MEGQRHQPMCFIQSAHVDQKTGENTFGLRLDKGARKDEEKLASGGL